MFTGLIEERGTVQAIERGEQSARFTIRANGVTDGVQLGDSITVNGACLTVVFCAENQLAFDAVYETLQKTALGALAIGDEVNLERSLAVGGRLGGHIVQGHVDGIGVIASIREVDNAYNIYITAPMSLMRYVVRKGSIAVDGISLTVVEADDKTFSVAIIPHTWENTNLRHRIAGDQVNLETDIIGKYIEKLTGGDYPRLAEIPTRVSDFAHDDYPAPSTATLYRE
ncbi:MAG: riboflavin synthase [Armatimonadota bacterium]|nr:riboflavin synthase [Armatimonadota bacterium]